MQPAVPPRTEDINDFDVLQILLKLSHIQPLEWEPQFIFLDPTTVCQVSQSMSDIMSKARSDLKRMMPLLKKWCTGYSKSHVLSHTAWIGRSLSIEECVSAVISVCIPIFQNEEDWNKRESEQQLAFAHAILGAALNSPSPLHPEAGKICVCVAERILKLKELDVHHHRFLAQIWNSVAELPFPLPTLVLMAERSFLGIERMMLWLGRRAVKYEKTRITEYFETIAGTIFLRICCQSSSVFQSVSDILLHMMVVSEAHPGIFSLTKAIVSGVEGECKKENTDICSLYKEPSQVLAALLSVDPTLLPENGDNVLSRETILKMINDLPRQEAACLLMHWPTWLLFT